MSTLETDSNKTYEKYKITSYEAGVLLVHRQNVMTHLGYSGKCYGLGIVAPRPM